ncbi:MAG: thioredoxin-dependent thiol peroxidase [Candidatus Gracilibacteria bacterium]|jgi:peroxiredoxin Q/BCP
MSLSIGQPAPEFNLKDQNGAYHGLGEYRGKWVFLYFYPKDDSPGCTIEACSVRDNFKQFEKLNCAVLGISTDTTKSHAKFDQKNKLSFTLLADDKKQTVIGYEVWGEKEFMGRQYIGTIRTSFLIDPEGKIRKIYGEVHPKRHIAEVLKDLNKIQNPKK